MSEDPKPEPPPVDETRHAELIRKHVYGNPERRTEGGRAPWFRYTSSASVGIEIAVAIVGCTLFAGWIELRFTHWSPWTTLIGFALGIGVAIKAIVRTAKQFQREVAEREQNQPVPTVRFPEPKPERGPEVDAVALLKRTARGEPEPTRIPDDEPGD